MSLKLRYFYGLAILLFPWVAVALIRTLGPIKFFTLNIETTHFFSLFLTISICGFSIFFLVKKSRKKVQTSALFGRGLKVMLLGIATLTLLYPLISFYDFFIVKGGALAEIAAIRESEHITGPRNSLIGALGALLSGAPPVALILLLTMQDRTKVHFKNTLYIFIALGFLATFLTGGRNSFFIGIIFVYFYYKFFLKAASIESKKMSMVNILQYLFFTACIVYSMKMFIDRFEAQGMDSSTMLDYLASEYDVYIHPAESSIHLINMVYSILVYLCFYITHAFTYIDQYFAITYEPHFGGAYNFPQISRLYDLVFATEHYNQVRNGLLVNGAYLTLPGSLYIDFGYRGALCVAFFLSSSLGYLARNLALLSIPQRVIYAYLCVSAIFSPIYSIFGMGNGFSLICMIFFLSLISIFSSKSSKFKNEI